MFKEIADFSSTYSSDLWESTFSRVLIIQLQEDAFSSQTTITLGLRLAFVILLDWPLASVNLETLIKIII